MVSDIQKTRTVRVDCPSCSLTNAFSIPFDIDTEEILLECGKCKAQINTQKLEDDKMIDVKIKCLSCNVANTFKIPIIYDFSDCDLECGKCKVLFNAKDIEKVFKKARNSIKGKSNDDVKFTIQKQVPFLEIDDKGIPNVESKKSKSIPSAIMPPTENPFLSIELPKDPTVLHPTHLNQILSKSTTATHTSGSENVTGSDNSRISDLNCTIITQENRIRFLNRELQKCTMMVSNKDKEIQRFIADQDQVKIMLNVENDEISKLNLKISNLENEFDIKSASSLNLEEVQKKVGSAFVQAKEANLLYQNALEKMKSEENNREKERDIYKNTISILENQLSSLNDEISQKDDKIDSMVSREIKLRNLFVHELKKGYKKIDELEKQVNSRNDIDIGEDNVFSLSDFPELKLSSTNNESNKSITKTQLRKVLIDKKGQVDMLSKRLEEIEALLKSDASLMKIVNMKYDNLSEDESDNEDLSTKDPIVPSVPFLSTEKGIPTVVHD